MHALANLGRLQRSRSRPPIPRQAMRTSAGTRRSPSLLFSSRELQALQEARPEGGAGMQSSTECDTERGTEASSGAKAKSKPQPYSAFRRHEGRTLSPRPYFQRGDQVGAADRPPTPRPTSTSQPLALADRSASPARRPLLVRKRQPRRSTSRSSRPAPARSSRPSPPRSSGPSPPRSSQLAPSRSTRPSPIRPYRQSSQPPPSRSPRPSPPRSYRQSSPRLARSPDDSRKPTS